MTKQYIIFEKQKTNEWNVVADRKEVYGVIRFHYPWKQFIFEPKYDTFWNYECLYLISEFLQLQNKLWRESNDS